MFEERCLLVPIERGLIVRIRRRGFGTLEWHTVQEVDVSDQLPGLAAQLLGTREVVPIKAPEEAPVPEETSDEAA